MNLESSFWRDLERKIPWDDLARDEPCRLSWPEEVLRLAAPRVVPTFHATLAFLQRF